MVFSRFGSGRQSSQLQAQKATLGSGTGASECAVWDRHAMVFSRFGSGRQSRQLQAQKATLGSGTGASEAPLDRHAMVRVYPFWKRPPKPSAAGFKG